MGRRVPAIEPKFSMSYASLMQLGDKAADNATRDQTELASYGIDSDWISNLAAEVQALKDLPTDEEFMYDLSEVIEARDAKRLDVTDRLRTIITKAKNTFPEGSATYRRFLLGTLDGYETDRFYRIASRVWRTATKKLAAFGAKLTQIELDDLKAAIDDYDEKVDEVEDAIEDRDDATEDRAAQGNKVYGLVTEVMDYGKDYWRDRDESRYNDYVIYRRDTEEPEPQEEEKDVAIGGTETFFEGDFDDATDFELTLLAGTSAIICRGDNPSDPCPGPNILLDQLNNPIIKQASEIGATGTLIKATNPSGNPDVARVRIRKL